MEQLISMEHTESKRAVGYPLGLTARRPDRTSTLYLED